jgi:hypothetical protein
LRLSALRLSAPGEFWVVLLLDRQLRMTTMRVLLAGLLLWVCLPAAGQTAGSIEGDVVDGDIGRGLSGARVKLVIQQDQPGEPWFTFTDDSGHFRFSGLATTKGYGIEAQQIGFMASPIGGGVALAQPGQTRPVRIELVRYAVIAGTVTDSSGAPVAQSEITVMRKAPPDRQDPVAQLFTDLRGAYRIARLRPGTYYVMAQPQTVGLSEGERRTERGTYYGGAPDLGGAKPIEAAAGRTIANVNIQLLKQAGVRVSGRITTRGTSEDVETLVSLRPLAGESGMAGRSFALVDGDRFELKDVMPGKYVLGALTREKFGRPGAQNELATAAQIVEVEQTDLSGLTIAPQPPRDLPGIVRFDGECHSGSVRLSVQAWMGHSTAEAVANADGGFILKNLLPSRYWLSASIDSDPFGALGAVRLGSAESQGGFLMSGEDYGPLLVEVVCPRGTVSGAVKDASGAPAKGAVVVLVPPQMPGFVRDDGRFDITARPGAYDVYVCSSPGGDPRVREDCQKTSGPLEVKDGANSPLVLTMPARKAGAQ